MVELEQTYRTEIIDSEPIGYAIRDRRGYISLYDYKANREPLNRARVWKNLPNVERYLQTDSYRRLAKHTDSDLVIEEISRDNITAHSRTVNCGGGQPITYGEWHSWPSTQRRATATIRTITLAEVQAAAAQASTRAERRARGLHN